MFFNPYIHPIVGDKQKSDEEYQEHLNEHPVLKKYRKDISYQNFPNKMYNVYKDNIICMFSVTNITSSVSIMDVLF